MRKLAHWISLTLLVLIAAACSNIQVNLVPTTGDTASDAEAAQQQMPNLSNYGYTSSNARSITDAIAAVGGSASLLTGNPAGAAAIAKIDDMIRCYENTGSVAAQVYTDANIANVVQGTVPKVGALAVINRERAMNNFLACAVNTGSGFSAQSAEVEPCAGSGSFVRNNVTYDFLYAATDPQLCSLFAQTLR